MVITSHMHITRGMDITGLSVVPGGRGVVWSTVTTRMSGRTDIITIGRIAMAIGEHAQLIILDEPLSGLDAAPPVRSKMCCASVWLPVALSS